MKKRSLKPNRVVGTGNSDLILGPNGNRVALIIGFGGNADLIISFGRASTANGDGLLMQTVSSPVTLTEELLGDNIKQSVFITVGAGIVGAVVEVTEP